MNRRRARSRKAALWRAGVESQAQAPSRVLLIQASQPASLLQAHLPRGGNAVARMSVEVRQRLRPGRRRDSAELVANGRIKELIKHRLRQRADRQGISSMA